MGCGEDLFEFLHHSCLVCIFYPSAGYQHHATRKDPPAEQAETLPHHSAGAVPFHGEQAEFSAANDPALGKFSFTGYDGNRHKCPCAAEGRTFQALKLRFELQFGAFTQM